MTSEMRIGPRTFAWGARTYIMGVINVSPESFAGDGLADPEAALEQARRFADEGADILDIGGQSTRPGADKTRAGFEELAPEDESRRVVPAIERIATALPDIPISVDTYKPLVARAALASGAHLVNDIWGLRPPAKGGRKALGAVGAVQSGHVGAVPLQQIVAEAGAPVVLMHNQRGRPSHDVIADVITGLRDSVRIATGAGIGESMIIVDPGFGFGWRPEHNIEMLRRLAELRVLGLPLLLGTSRKSTIGALLGGAPVEERLFGTAATVALSIANGADMVRVHDVRAMKQVALLADAVRRGWRPPQADPI